MLVLIVCARFMVIVLSMFYGENFLFYKDKKEKCVKERAYL